jgi:riboflavin biosynthesis pyrimidine reductase
MRGRVARVAALACSVALVSTMGAVAGSAAARRPRPIPVNSLRTIDTAQEPVVLANAQRSAIGGGAVWLATADGVDRVDLASGVATPVFEQFVAAMAFGEEGLWITAACAETLQLLAPESGALVREIPAPPTCEFVQQFGGANLAAHAFRDGLIDECHLFIAPVVLGRAKPSLPGDLHAELELLDERRFDNGVVYVPHRIRT